MSASTGVHGLFEGGAPEAIIGQLERVSYRVEPFCFGHVMTELQDSFRRLRQTGDYKEALRPSLRARLIVAGAITPPYDRRVFHARLSDVTGAPCITASEHEQCIVGDPGVVPISFMGIDLIFAMDSRQDLLLQWPEKAEYLEAEQVEWFRETVRRNPFLRNEHSE